MQSCLNEIRQKEKEHGELMEGNPRIIKNKIPNKINLLERHIIQPLKKQTFQKISPLSSGFKSQRKKHTGYFLLFSFSSAQNLPFLNKSTNRIFLINLRSRIKKKKQQ